MAAASAATTRMGAVDVRLDQRREPCAPITLTASVPLLVNTDSVFLHFMAYKGGHETRDAAVQWLLRRTEKLAAVEASSTLAKVAYTVRQRSPEVDEQLVSTGGGATANTIKVYNASYHFAFELSLVGPTSAPTARDWSECKKLMHAVYIKIAHDVGMKLVQRRFLYEKNIVDATASALAKATHVIRQRAQAIAAENRSRLLFPAFSVRESRSFDAGASEESDRTASAEPQAMMASYDKPRGMTRSKRSGSGSGGGASEELDCDDKNVELLFQQPPPVEITSSVTIVYETEANASDLGARKGEKKK